MSHNISLWQETTATAVRPAASGPERLRADVVIIGGGISGLTTARLLAPHMSVVLLEAREIGSGTTGRSTGNLYVTVDKHLSVLAQKWGDETARQVVESRSEALEYLRRAAGVVECDFVEADFCHFAESQESTTLEFLDREQDAMERLGLAPRRDALQLPFATRSTLSLPGQAQMNPWKYARGLAAQLPESVVVREQCPVLEFDASEHCVRTLSGEQVEAGTIVLATHTPKGIHVLHTLLSSVREYGVAARVREPHLPPGIFWRADSPKRSLRSYRHGERTYAVVIGETCKTGQHEDPDGEIRELEEYLRQHADVEKVTHRWGAQSYQPADGLPYIGSWEDNVYLMTGFSTDGLVYGTLAGMIVADQILGRENRWEPLYKAKRFTPAKSAKDLLKEGVDNLRLYLGELPSRGDVESFDEIRPDQGAVISQGGEKLAVYRDGRGGLHAVSAVCTHMKCIVRWNDAEKSWDCPCHGSRFDISGGVLEGPALTPLPKKEL